MHTACFFRSVFHHKPDQIGVEFVFVLLNEESCAACFHLSQRVEVACNVQVQYISLSQTPAQKCLKLCTVVFWTASKAVRLVGVAKEEGVRLKRCAKGER